MPQWEPVPSSEPQSSTWDESLGIGAAKERNRSMARKLSNYSSYAVTFKEQLLYQLAGWRTGIALCALLSTGVLALNLVLAVVAYLNLKRNIAGTSVTDGLSTLWAGDCGTAKSISLGSHLVINVLSTVLLGASNYCMQILVSPTRDEIDAAHTRKKWLRIAVPNFQNLVHIDWRRAVICAVLAITSIPLHLLWNSAVVQTVSSNDFFVGGVTRDFLNGANATADEAQLVDQWFNGDVEDFKNIWFPAVRNSSVKHLTPSECIDAYGVPMVQGYLNVALVFDVNNSTNSLLFAATHQTGSDDEDRGLGDTWVCGLPAPTSPKCEYKDLAKENGTYWTPLSFAANWTSNPYLHDLARGNISVESCLAQTVESRCRIGTTPTILYAIVVANAAKLLCFICTWLLVSHRPRHEGEERIVTSGDLIASYLRQPDTRFAGRCLASARLVRDSNQSNHDDSNATFWDSDRPMPLPWLGGRTQRNHKTVDEAKAREATQRSSAFAFLKCGRGRSKTKPPKTAPRWHTGPSGMTWLIYILPSALCIITLFALYFGFSLQDKLFLGFGQASTQTTVSIGPGSGPGEDLGVLKSTLLANIPQLVATYVYVACNSVLTSMLAHHEVSSYAIRRRGLRVSFPKRKTAQRDTYFLQVPYKLALPLMVTSTALHWLLSQSLFLLRVAVYGPDDKEISGRPIATVGYSSSPVLAALGLLAFFIVGTITLSWVKRYKGAEQMPLVATCSASLAAATCPAASASDKRFLSAEQGGHAAEKSYSSAPLSASYPTDTSYRCPFNVAQEASGFEEDIADKALMWGVIPSQYGAAVDDDTVGHATFSAGEVHALKIGRRYA
ncbi:uncharacterized protein JN550_003662 [Neoarthrinium moseri]|uniref:uncharacterized protein n=1 Tax=Neoarthrinium moseri TaxID=1658444 RepID=UPI001FDBCB05|nr:uncharacterized protein JN550_003662 [Neoarthrinium moseri]KAI1872788.1 hypothetical protein JN550_003662 [Neoarthrinium moseri]